MDIFYQVLDIETSGFSPEKGAEVAELAIITCKNNEIIDIYHSYFCVQYMHPGAIEAHGLSTGMLFGWPKFNSQNVKYELRNLIKYPIFAHNSKFDAGFLRYYGVINQDHTVIDTLNLCKQESNGPENNKLVSWAKWLGLIHRPHGALSDAFVLCQLIATKQWYLKVLDYQNLKAGVF